MSKMVDVHVFAQMHGVDRSTVCWWCKTGKIPGVVMVNVERNGFFRQKYMIPADAQPVSRRKPYQKRAKAVVEKPKRREMTEREKSLYIIKYCGIKTYREIADALGMDVMEVRRRYDHLHDRMGV